MSYLARELLDRLAFDLEKADARQAHARVEQGRVILPRELRMRFVHGERPAVTTWGREPCPIEPGMTYQIAPRLELVFTDVRRHRKGHHQALYTVRDYRPLSLRTRPSDATTSSSEKRHWSPAEEHGYSHSADTLDAGEVLDEIEQRKVTEAARVRAAQADVLARARRERYELEQRLQRAIEDAERRGVDISSPVRVIERQLGVIERRLYEGKAA